MMSNSKELWQASANHDLHSQYPTPTTEELMLHWKAYNPLADTEPAPGIYGVTTPVNNERAVTTPAIISIDLCEVMRGTADAVMRVKGQSVNDMDYVASYGAAIGLGQNDIVPLVQVLMNEDHVEPIVSEIEIRSILRSWRGVGAYCIANTSTLPGYEIPTINFLRRHFSGCFDGLLLPRNHDGSGAISKGMAARFLVEKYYGEKQLLAIHIDDATHHNAGFIEAMGELEHVHPIAFMPAYRGNEAQIRNTTRTESVLESFVLANDALQSWRRNNA